MGKCRKSFLKFKIALQVIKERCSGPFLSRKEKGAKNAQSLAFYHLPIYSLSLFFLIFFWGGGGLYLICFFTNVINR